MIINKWWRYAIIAAVLLFLLILGHRGLLWPWPRSTPSPHDNTAAPEKVSLALDDNSALYIPLYIAINEGFFTDEGLAVTLKTASSQDEALALLLSGDCDILLGGPEITFRLAQQKNKTHLIQIAQATSSTGYFVVARNNDKPFVWQDMKGKIVISAHPAELPGIIFNLVLKENQLHPLHDVHIIHNLPYASVQAAFQSGTGHFLLASEPLATKMEKDNNCHVVAALKLTSGPAVTSTFMVMSEFREKRQETCQSFVTAFQKGLGWTDEHSPEEIVSAVQGYFPKEDAKILLRSVSRYKNLGCWPLTALMDNKAFEQLQDILQLENELIVKPNLNKLMDNTFAEKALENAR